MTEYDFVVVQMTKINECFVRFLHLNNARTQRVSALWCEKIKGQVHWFLSFAHEQNYIPFHSWRCLWQAQRDNYRNILENHLLFQNSQWKRGRLFWFKEILYLEPIRSFWHIELFEVFSLFDWIIDLICRRYVFLSTPRTWNKISHLETKHS